MNGVHGIGTGWSTSIPPHHPLDVLRAVATRIDDDEERSSPGATQGEPPAVVPLLPWFRGFVGRLLEAPPTRDEAAARAAAEEEAEEAAYNNGGVVAAANGDDKDEATTGARFLTRGVAKVLNATTVEVTELPVGR